MSSLTNRESPVETDIQKTEGSVSVSIIMPAFNAEATIARALESVLAQTSPNWEVVVIDDGSTDSTVAVVQGFRQRDSRIRMVRQEHQRQAAARNAGIGEARHDWLLFLDADDWISPLHLERLTRELVRDPGLDAVASRSARVAADGTEVIESYEPPSGDLFSVFAKRPAFPNHACIVRKNLVESVGMFDTSIQTSEDWDLWQRIARTGARFGTVRDVLAFYRMRENSSSLDASQLLRDGLRVLKQGHSPDPRVSNPHPDHVNGAPPAEMNGQEFYLVCWCAGLMLGSGQDARALLTLVEVESCPPLFADAVAKCIFESVPLPSSRPLEAWINIAPTILKNVDDCLLALEQSSKTINLAGRAGYELRKMILSSSALWQSVINEYDSEIMKWKETAEQCKQIAEEREKWRLHWQQLYEEKEKERSQWQEIADEREKWRLHWQQLHDKKENERRELLQDTVEEREKWTLHSEQVAEAKQKDWNREMQMLRKSYWVRLGSFLRLIKSQKTKS